MAALEDLSEEEKYLWAILSDASGVDPAEFIFVDQENDDGCFRAWPFQWTWLRTEGPLQVDRCARSVGKSLSIKMRAFAFPFIHPGKEMVITGPEGVHVDAITDLIETQFLSCRLGRGMLVAGRSGVRHRPFHMNFQNGARIMGRIPQHDGKGVKGVHPIALEMDEASDYPEAGWTELIETLKRGFVGASWRAHGVTRGVRDKFYEVTDTTNPENSWIVHKLTAMHRPNWTDEERQEKIRLYGSKDDPDYRRNVLGEPGDASSPMFALHRLMICVDDNKSSDYNMEEYYHVNITDNVLDDGGGDIRMLLDFPGRHLADYRDSKGRRARYWVGMDVGYLRDPSEILVFVEHVPAQRFDRAVSKWVQVPKADLRVQLKLLSRVSLKRIPAPDQAEAIASIMEFYQPAAFAMDKTGAGLPLFQFLQKDHPDMLDRIKGYGFSEKILVDFDASIEIDQYRGDVVKDAGIFKNVVEAATDKLREMVDGQMIYFPWDRNLIGQFQGATITVRRSGQDQYGRTKIFSGGEDHGLDAARMAVLGYSQDFIEEMTKNNEPPPVLDLFF